MSSTGHLWALGYDDMERASQVREEFVKLGWVSRSLILSDLAVVVRHPDGSFTVNREPSSVPRNILSFSAVGLLAGLVVGLPTTGAGIGALMGLVGSAAAKNVGIGENFVREVQELMKPGTSALFILDYEGDMDSILHQIRGLGGTVLKTNVDAERVKLIQSTLAAQPTDTRP
jgi:uncharacterized membrane protein